MNLEKYFEDNKGVGVLSTASDSYGVNSALYARPHVIDNNLIAFIMRDKLTRANLLENNSASYLFIEDNQGFKGVRMYLEKSDEIQNDEKIELIARRPATTPSDGEDRYLVYFKVSKALSLIGSEEIPLQ